MQFIYYVKFCSSYCCTEWCSAIHPKNLWKADTAKQCSCTNTEAYYRCAMSILMLDELCVQMELKFGKHQTTAAKGLSILPCAIASAPDTCKKAAMDFAMEYKDDLPAGQDLSTFGAELERWMSTCVSSSANDVPQSLVEAINMAQTSLFPCILQLLSLLAVLPVTTCSCECSISSLRRLKTYLRSTMVNPRLNGLALLHVHYALQVDADDVIRRFLLMRPRSIITPISAPPTTATLVEGQAEDHGVASDEEYLWEDFPSGVNCILDSAGIALDCSPQHISVLFSALILFSFNKGQSAGM